MQRLRSLLGLLIVAAVVYVSWKVAPSFYANFQLEAAIEDIARLRTADTMGSSGFSEPETRDKVLQAAQKLDISLRPEQVWVQQAQGETMIWADYTVHIDLPVHPLDLHFQPASKSKKRNM